MLYLRIDRLVTLYFFYPLIRMIHSHKERHIPILMYHSISECKENKVHPYYQINTSPDIFAEHMRFLYDNNYSVTPLQDIKRYFELEEKRKNKCVAITFDDGYHNFYTKAFSILQKYGFNSTVFLPTGFIENKGLKSKEKRTLTWNEVRELHKNGVKFGSHTVTHPQLKFLKKENIEYEIRHSKEAIEDKLGESIDSFSYPFAFPEEDKEFTKYLRDILQKFGYKYGVSTRIGTASKKDDIYFLKRIPVNSCDDIPLFKAKLEGGYDWLYNIQLVSKIIKSKVLQRHTLVMSKEPILTD